MEFVDSMVEFLGLCPSDEDEILKRIEDCARMCWKSEGKIDYPNRSFEKFYSHLLNVGHLSAIEHSNIVVEYEFEAEDIRDEVHDSFLYSCSSRLGFFRTISEQDDDRLVISGNLRAWHEFLAERWWYLLREQTYSFLNNVYPILFPHYERVIEHIDSLRSDDYYRDQFNVIDRVLDSIGDVKMRIVSLEEQENNFDLYNEWDIPLYTFVAICDRGITHEIVRHRVLSFSQESTRYVNYAKRGLQFINFDLPDHLEGEYVDLMSDIEKFYNKLIENGVKPQFARNVLPHSIKSEIAMTGRRSGWENFIELRDSNKAHPDIRFIGQYVRECFDEICANA